MFADRVNNQYIRVRGEFIWCIGIKRWNGMSMVISFLKRAIGKKKKIAELRKMYTFFDWEWGRNSRREG